MSCKGVKIGFVGFFPCEHHLNSLHTSKLTFDTYIPDPAEAIFIGRVKAKVGLTKSEFAYENKSIGIKLVRQSWYVQCTPHGWSFLSEN